MDKDDQMYAEFVFQTMKRNPRDFAADVAEDTHAYHKNSSIKELRNFDHVFKYLSELSLISITYNSTGRGKPQFLELTSIGERVETVESRLRELRFDEYNQQKRAEREEANRATEIEYFKRQNWLAKYWWATTSVSAIVGAVIGVIVQKFLFC
jgi:hypothetical protein